MSEPGEWITLNPTEFTKSRHEKARNGVQIRILTSPYDVPEAVRGSYDRDSRCFRIEFRYMEDEPTVERVAAVHIRLRIGRHSQRLHQIEIDLSGRKEEPVSLEVCVTQLVAEVDRAIRELAIEARGRRGSKNYSVTQEVLSHRSKQLFAPLGAT